ncbi:putative Phospho-N-acetylmuramoyl-pentapeptide-transferase [Melia azedarach]|uniref:Phospho-N-acetylmuramoyl-pentapeptide-transferase n=1 Tax=Melia azedarach TaxID=155640 RepID=A0ACC1Z1P5_MELAZ|nr:putative Phospho-N-acetylmuramoyl-pentapeptide-transferase [Melia azedarach]
MKKSGLLAASVAAASATAISASSTNFACSSSFQVSHEDDSKKDYENSTMQRSSSTEKFAPRFDGLRFIETLVTAHR